jgi:hypothetical protein
VIAVACTASTPARSGTLEGTVLSAPSCPVERVGSPCPPRPVAGATVEAYRGSHGVAQTATGRSGGFLLRLPAGSYLVRATNVGGYRSTAATQVTVSADRPVSVTLTVDSGIR